MRADYDKENTIELVNYLNISLTKKREKRVKPGHGPALLLLKPDPAGIGGLDLYKPGKAFTEAIARS